MQTNSKIYYHETTINPYRHSSDERFFVLGTAGSDNANPNPTPQTEAALKAEKKALKQLEKAQKEAAKAEKKAAKKAERKLPNLQGKITKYENKLADRTGEI